MTHYSISCGTGFAHLSAPPDITPSFELSSFCSILSFLCCFYALLFVCVDRRCLYFHYVLLYNLFAQTILQNNYKMQRYLGLYCFCRSSAIVVVVVCCPVLYTLQILNHLCITRYKFFPRYNNRFWISRRTSTADTNISGIFGCYLQISRYRVFKSTCRAQRNWKHINSDW